MLNKNLNTKKFIVFGLLYLSLILAFFLNEDANGGAIQDWIGYKLLINEFLNNFNSAFLNYDEYGNRHSPLIHIILSFLYKLNLTEVSVRFLHLNFSLISILFFYKCLLLKYKNIDKNLLYLIPLVFFISPTFRSLSIWPDSRIFGFHFLVISTFYYLKFFYFKKELKYVFLNVFFLAISAYFSPNFCLFAIYFFYKFFNHYKFSKEILYIILLNIILALPAFYYLFVLEIFFLTAGDTPGNYVNEYGIKNNYNISNKILIISTLIMFYFFPISIIKKKIFVFTNNIKLKEIIFIGIISILLVQFFNYETYYTGGGIFFHLSHFLFNNNLLFFLISFYSIIFVYKICVNKPDNLFIIILLICSNPQLSIYHKYYDPLLIFFIFSLFTMNFKKSFFKIKNILFIYIFYFLFLSISLIKFIF